VLRDQDAVAARADLERHRRLAGGVAVHLTGHRRGRGDTHAPRAPELAPTARQAGDEAAGDRGDEPRAARVAEQVGLEEAVVEAAGTRLLNDPYTNAPSAEEKS